MQAIASEMNLSETAFFVPRPGTAKRSEYDLRWFTPLLEVDLCGHVTLASGHLIFKHMKRSTSDTDSVASSVYD